MDNQPPSLPPLRNVIERFGLSARKSLGQHFLLDNNITEKIVRISGEHTGVNVIEVGPGPGGLTRSLLASDAQCVYAIEKDDRCVAALQELSTLFSERLVIYEQDALKFSYMDIIKAPRAIVANLPYNVGTLLLINWLEDIAVHGREAYRSLTLMFQKEVAERLFASPNSKQYGRLSVFTQWLCDVQHGFDLSPSAFTPPPKVASSVIKLTPRATPLFPADKENLERTVAAAFGQRRKMLRSALSVITKDTNAWLEKAGIDPTRRAETLSVEEFCRLSQLIP
jgi:16S rRNA (adenine1518-N6/adenine1519-N6)-dimethyltransferase